MAAFLTLFYTYVRVIAASYSEIIHSLWRSIPESFYHEFPFYALGRGCCQMFIRADLERISLECRNTETEVIKTAH